MEKVQLKKYEMVLNVLMFSKLHDFSLFRVKILTSKTNLIAKCLIVCLGLVTSQLKCENVMSCPSYLSK